MSIFGDYHYPDYGALGNGIFAGAGGVLGADATPGAAPSPDASTTLPVISTGPVVQSGAAQFLGPALAGIGAYYLLPKKYRTIGSLVAPIAVYLAMQRRGGA